MSYFFSYWLLTATVIPKNFSLSAQRHSEWLWCSRLIAPEPRHSSIY